MNDNEKKVVVSDESINKDDLQVSEEIKIVKKDAPIYEEVEVVKKVYSEDESCFDGKLIELIGYKILSFIMTIFSLGIASPWGRCLVISYKVNHTIINGRRLKFEGTGGSLFVNRFKWIFLTIITLGIYAFWVPIKIKKWELSNIHFEDEAYIQGESFFDGKLIGLIGINFISRVLNIFTFGLLYPFTVCIKLRWFTKHAVINKKKLIFKGSASGLFLHYLLWFFLTLITFGIYGLWLNIKMIKWQTKNTHLKRVDEEYTKDKSIIWVSICSVILLGVGIPLISNLITNLDIIDSIKEEFFQNYGSDEEQGVQQVDTISANIKVIRKARTYDDKIVVFVKNNNSFPVNITAKVVYNKNGEKVGSKSGFIYAISPGYESIVAVNSPGKDFDNYDLKIKARESEYSEQLRYVSYKVHNKAYVEVKKTREINNLELGMVFYNNGQIVGYSANDSGGYLNNQIKGMLFDVPSVSFNSYECYLIQAYNK